MTKAAPNSPAAEHDEAQHAHTARSHGHATDAVTLQAKMFVMGHQHRNGQRI